MPTYNQEEYDKYRQNVSSAMIGLTSPLVGSIPKIAGNMFKEDFENQINRVDFLDSDNAFAEADPALKKAYIQNGKYGLLTEYDDVFSKHIPIGQGHVPADITKAGEFLNQKLKDNRRSILTVTPEAVSKRFESGDVDAGVGGGSSATLWGNPEIPQYGYARGNLGVKEVIGSNPSAQFSAVELPPEDKREYLRTTDVIEEGASKRGWGQFNNLEKEDMHFGKEYRKAGGLTTANDIYTYLNNKGVKVPLPTGQPDRDLADLTEALSETVNKKPYDALESIASPAPTWGASQRELGQLPTLTSYDVDNKNISKTGIGSFFEKVDPKDLESGKINPLHTRVPFSDKSRVAFSEALENFKDGANHIGIGNRLSRVGAGGLAATAFTSTEVADDIKKGDYASAGLKTGAAYGTGELASSLVNKGVTEISKKGATWAPKAAAGIGTVLSPLAGIEAIDTASTLATGKNSRELLVESGNTGPAISASMAPTSIAPLGMAGGPVQATVPIDKERYAEAKKLEANSEAARKRGGRWRFAGVAVPEFGLSEILGLNK